MTSDGELLRRYTESNSEDAFAELVQRHLDLVYSAALRQVNGDAPLAQDVAQTVFADLARKAASLAGRPSLAGWLYTGTHYAAAKAVRTEQRRHTREQEAHAMQQLLQDPGPNPDWETLRPVLDTAMHELNETEREMILLRYFENRPHADIGEQLGLSENAARMRIERAVEKLRTFFAKRGVTVGASGLVVVISANAVQAAPVGLAVTISAAAALAGTTIAVTATATKAIAMNAVQKTLIGATLAAAVGTGIYEAHRASTLHSQVQMLQRQQTPLNEQVERLGHERDATANQVAALRDENEGLTRNTAELLALRGKVSRLRQVEQELAHLKDSIQDVNAVTNARRIAFGTEIQDMGAATPERAATSLIWAASTGEQARVSELLELPDNVLEQDALQHYEFFTKQLSNVFSGMEFTSIETIKPNPDGTLRLNLVQRNLATGKTNSFPFMMRLHDSGWKVVVEGKAPNMLPITP